jgi:hypothetical protein
MIRRISIDREHPLRQLFRKALEFGLKYNPPEKPGVTDYIEEQILSEFIHVDNLYKIRDSAGRNLGDIADMLVEGEVLLEAQSFQREFQVHKHIGDYTLFMLGMFPSVLVRKRGKDFIIGRLVLPEATLFEYYMLQGQRSYSIASEFTNKELFMELSSNFRLYKNVLELVRVYLESAQDREFLKAKKIIGGTD